jgi:integration host factor subunit beta
VTKRELVVDIAEKLGYTQNEVSDVVQTTLDTITEVLASGDRLEVRNFGVFEVKVRDARVGRNPRTGETVPIEEKRVPFFKPGKALKERVEKNQTVPDPPSARETGSGPMAPGM